MHRPTAFNRFHSVVGQLESQLVLLVIAFGLTACTFDASPLEPCSRDEDCPSAKHCVIGYCVAGVAASPDLAVELDADVSPSFCGAQQLPCPSDEICCPSSNAIGTCEQGGEDCLCLSVSSNPEHCGACGRRCDEGETCLAGACLCNTGSVDCGEGCVDIFQDPQHCGDCERSCADGLDCQNALCVCDGVLCDPGMHCCAGEQGAPRCVDLLLSPRHCGACGVACGEGERCEGGRCYCGTLQAEEGSSVCQDASCCAGQCAPADSEICNCGGQGPCPLGTVCCDSVCRNLSSDRDHCGACDSGCIDEQFCSNGVCQCPAERPNLCSGHCVDAMADPSNCGSCGLSCGGASCCDGQCSWLNDERHCGGCGVSCDEGLNCCGDTCVDVLATLPHPLHCDPLDCALEGSIRSYNGDRARLRVLNHSGHMVKIYWLNGGGSRVDYGQIGGQPWAIDTFVSHLWLLTDLSGNCLGIYKTLPEENELELW